MSIMPSYHDFLSEDQVYYIESATVVTRGDVLKGIQPKVVEISVGIDLSLCDDFSRHNEIEKSRVTIEDHYSKVFDDAVMVCFDFEINTSTA